MRTFSGHVFTVKTLTGSWVGFVGGQLPEVGLTKAAVASKMSAVFAENRPSGQGGKLIASVGFVERPMWNVELAKPVQALVQLAFISNATDDEMGMG